jgi:hypothetical protein
MHLTLKIIQSGLALTKFYFKLSLMNFPEFNVLN